MRWLHPRQTLRSSCSNQMYLAMMLLVVSASLPAGSGGSVGGTATGEACAQAPPPGGLFYAIFHPCPPKRSGGAGRNGQTPALKCQQLSQMSFNVVRFMIDSLHDFVPTATRSDTEAKRGHATIWTVSGTTTRLGRPRQGKHRHLNTNNDHKPSLTSLSLILDYRHDFPRAARHSGPEANRGLT